MKINHIPSGWCLELLLFTIDYNLNSFHYTGPVVVQHQIVQGALRMTYDNQSHPIRPT